MRRLREWILNPRLREEGGIVDRVCSASDAVESGTTWLRSFGAADAAEIEGTGTSELAGSKPTRGGKSNEEEYKIDKHCDQQHEPVVPVNNAVRFAEHMRSEPGEADDDVSQDTHN
jgi:hypothetical protein